MKKIFLFTTETYVNDTLLKLRKLGVVHLENIILPQTEKINLLQNDLNLIQQAILILQAFNPKNTPSNKNKGNRDWRVISQHIVDLSKRLKHLEDYSITLLSKIEELKEWGDFNPQDILQLAQKGFFLRFYILTDEQIRALPKEIYLAKIKTRAGLNYCVIVSREKLELPYKETTLPLESLHKLEERLDEDKKVSVLIKKELEDYLIYLDFLKETKNKITKELQFYEALAGMKKEGKLTYLKGFIPFDCEDILLKTARQEGWAVFITDPDENDNVPTLIRNPRWVRIIEPVFKLIEVIPGYQEVDISFWFLIFFSIFFGILIGDAGYGLVYLLLTLILQKKFSKNLQDKGVFILFYILSISAIIWGILTATFFGQNWLNNRLTPLLPFLRDDKTIQGFCFFLGALHLSIAHLWRLVLKFPSLSFLAELGWVGILWSAFFIASSLILGDTSPFFWPYLLTISALLIIFFSNPQKNILKGLGSGIGNLLLNLMNNFTDIVSYIRLFAVGLATIAVADAFNQMALESGFNNLPSSLLTSFILLAGHLLNILMGPLSILVHGVRLNVLEFCSHLDVKWSGFKYQPFREE